MKTNHRMAVGPRLSGIALGLLFASTAQVRAAERTIDVAGVRAGMTVTEAMAELKKYRPQFEAQTKGEHVIASYSASDGGTTTTTESVRFNIVGPRQVVWEIERDFRGKPLKRAEVVTQLHQKYGDSPKSEGALLKWQIDEEGKPVPGKCVSRPDKAGKWKGPLCITIESEVTPGDSKDVTHVRVRVTNPFVQKQASTDTRKSPPTKAP
jgi:hypothetical protein